MDSGLLTPGKRIGERVSTSASVNLTLSFTWGESRSHTSKYLLTAALPITAMNVNVAGRFRISGGIQVPLGPIRLSISQIEVLRALRAESLRGCSPPFGFLPSKFRSHMCHILKIQVA